MEWLFSGIGAVLLGGIVTMFTKKKGNSPTQKINSGKNSTNIQGGGDVTVTLRELKNRE